MNKSLSFLTIGLVCCVAVSGCANKEKQLIGKWKATNIDVPASAASNPGVAMLKGMMSSITLEIKPDKTFAMQIVVPMEGDWAISATGATLTPKKIAGMTMDSIKQMAKSSPNGNMLAAQNPDQAMNAKLSDDGKTLTIDGNQGGQGAMTFTKDAS